MSEEPGDDEPTPEPAEDADTDGSDGGDGDSDDFTFPVEESDGSGADEPDQDGADREQTAADSDQSTSESERPAEHAGSGRGDSSSSSDDHLGEPPVDATVDLSERWSADPADRDTADPFASDASDDGDATGGTDGSDDADEPAEADGRDGDDGDADEPDSEGSDTDDGDPPSKVNHAPFGKAGTPDDPHGETRDQRPGADADELEGGRDDAADSEPPYDHTASTSENGSTRPDDARATAASDGAGATAGDGGTATGAGGTTSTEGSTGTGGSTLGGHVSTPPDDEELPLTEHIEEMLSRLGIVVVVATLATLAVVPFSGELIGQIWYDVHPGAFSGCVHAPRPDSCTPPHVYGPFEFVLMRIRVAGLAGILVALPLVVYQTYRFMRPGLYPKERRYYLASVPFSLVLGAVGMLFSYFVILPLLFEYFITYTEGSAEAAFALSDTMGLVLVMLGMTAVIFQIPLFIMLAIMMGLVTREWLEGRRIYFWGLFLGVAFLFGPDPTGMAPVLLTGTMIVLFEATLLLLRWTGR